MRFLTILIEAVSNLKGSLIQMPRYAAFLITPTNHPQPPNCYSLETPCSIFWFPIYSSALGLAAGFVHAYAKITNRELDQTAGSFLKWHILVIKEMYSVILLAWNNETIAFPSQLFPLPLL